MSIINTKLAPPQKRVFGATSAESIKPKFREYNAIPK